MDSMRTLNTSLPRSPRKGRTTQPPEELLQHFKSAALSVTNLYKTAAADNIRTREAGYQDALDDLLTFLDKENLGLGDGEGWKVRRWATERLDGTPPVQIGSESDEERMDTEKRATSPVSAPERKSSPEASVHEPSKSNSPTRADHNALAADTPSPPPLSPVLVKSQGFTFVSAHPYPKDIDMQTSETHSDPTTPAPTTTPAVRFDVLPRSTRSAHKHNNHSNRHHAKPKLGSGAGSKRKIILPNFFDLGDLGDGKEVFGGNVKRGRLN